MARLNAADVENKSLRAQAATVNRNATEPGEHTVEILNERGIRPGMIETLLASGSVAQARRREVSV
ncbi:hypothetical protein [Streptomyces sp. NPDC004685]